jgi:uncharacterized protein YqeY
MSLLDKIDQDLKQSMKSGQTVEVSVLRFLKSALKYSALEKRTQGLSDADIQQVIQKQIKQRKESIEQFAKGGRKDLADREAQELAILERYLPKQISDSELVEIIGQETAAAQAASKKDFGRMMKLLTEKLAGRADAKRVSEALGRILGV